MWGSGCLCSSMCGCSQRPEKGVIDALEMELNAVLRFPLWVLSIKHGSFQEKWAQEHSHHSNSDTADLDLQQGLQLNVGRLFLGTEFSNSVLRSEGQIPGLYYFLRISISCLVSNVPLFNLLALWWCFEADSFYRSILYLLIQYHRALFSSAHVFMLPTKW